MNKKISKIAASMLLGTIITYTLPISAFTKDETVYSNLKSDGEEYQTIVTTHLINEEDEKILKDLTDLLNIENTTGDEEFSQNGESLVWEADSNDIYYKGETDKELPIKINVKYELDGETIDAKDIAGKSGKVKITIEFENQEEKEVLINGKKETMYTPFVVAMGTYINNSSNKNIEVTNGKAIDDGTKTMVIGLAFPGMQESLGISENTIKIPTNIEITMEATDFEMNNIISYATPKVIEESDLDIFSKLDDVYSKVNTLQSASNQIEEGAVALAEGTTTYLEKSGEFNTALGKVSAGASSLNTNYEVFSSGVTELATSLSALPESTEKLYDATSQVVAGLNGDGTAINPGLVAGVNKLVDSTTETSTTLVNGLKELVTGYETAITELKSTNEALETAKELLDQEKQAAAIAKIDAQIESNNVQIQKYTTMKNAITEKLTAMAETDNTAQLATIKTGIATIQTAMTTVNEGLAQLNAKADTLSEKLPTLTSGAQEIGKGIQSLDLGAKSILTADGQLIEGAKTIQEGAQTLATGTQEFNETGITPICNYVLGDLKDVSTRAKKLKELSEEYNTFTKIDDENEGKVKFITIVDSIKKDDENKGQQDIDEKTNN